MSKTDLLKRWVDSSKKATRGPWFAVSDGAAVMKVCTNSWKEHSYEDGEWICSGSCDTDGYAEAEAANFEFIALSRAMP